MLNRVAQIEQRVRIGIITALPKEFSAVELMLDSPTAFFPPTEGASHRYVLGEIPAANGGFHSVVLAPLTEIGNGGAAVRATQLTHQFPSIRHIIMCGIGGGIPAPGVPDEDVRLGDIVVSDGNGVVGYDFIRHTPTEIEPRPPPRPPDAELLDAVRILEAGRLKFSSPWEKYLNRAASLEGGTRPAENLGADGTPIEYPHDPKRKVGFPRIFFGPIASANRLLKDPAFRDALKTKFKVKAVEMEGAGIADAAWLNNRAGYLVVRGICDFCDSRKGDLWQGYAAVAAAAYVRALIETMPSHDLAPSNHRVEVQQKKPRGEYPAFQRHEARAAPSQPGVQSTLLDEIEKKKKVDDYQKRMADWLYHDLRQLVPTSILTSVGTKKSDAALEFLLGGRHGQLVGPSGCGKTHLAKHMASSGLRNGVVPIFVRVRYYAGDLAMLLDDSIAHLYQGSSEDLIHACHEQSLRSVLIFDGINECATSLRERFLEELQAICFRWGIVILLTAQSSVALPRELALETFRFEELGREERRQILAEYSVRDNRGFADDLYEAFRTAYELSLAAECAAEGRNVRTRSDLLDKYCRRICEKQGGTGTIHRVLCVIAECMTRLMVSSLSLHEARRVSASLLDAEGVPHRVFDEIVKCGLLEVQQERCSFRHELLQRYFEATALLQKHKDPASIAAELQRPIHMDLAEFAVALQEDPRVVRECVDRVVDERQLSECLSGRWGQIAQALIRADCLHLLRNAEKTLKNIDMEVESKNSKWLDITVHSHDTWTTHEEALMDTIGRSLKNGLFVQETFHLVRRTETYCREYLYKKHGESSAVRSKVKATLLWKLFVRGTEGTLPASRIALSCRLSWPDSRIERIEHRALEGVVDRLGNLTTGELYLVCLLLPHASEKVLQKLPELLRICWASNVAHLRIEALQAAQSKARVLEDPLLSKVKNTLASFETNEVLLSTVLIDSLLAYGMVDPPVDPDSAFEEMEAVLQSPPNEATHRLAYGIVCKMFEDVFQDVYDEAFERLSVENRVKFLARASLGASKDSFFSDWILRRLAGLNDPEALPAFLYWINNFEPDPRIITDVTGRYVWALVGCARLLEAPPDFLPPKSKAHHAWQLCGQIIFWMNRTDLSNADVSERCAPLWEQLVFEFALEAVEPVTKIRWSTGFGSGLEENPVASMFERFSEPIRKILEFGLGCESSFPTIYPPFAADYERQFKRIIEGLSLVGDWQSVLLLERYVDSEEYGLSAVESLKKLKNRLVG